MILNAETTKAKTDKWDFIKLANYEPKEKQ